MNLESWYFALSLGTLLPLFLVIPHQIKTIRQYQNGYRMYRITLLGLVLSMIFFSGYPIFYLFGHYYPAVVPYYPITASALLFASAWGYYFLYKHE